jgi:hypothetical protein
VLLPHIPIQSLQIESKLSKVFRLEATHFELFCGGSDYVAFDKPGSRIRISGVLERHIIRLQGLKEPEKPSVFSPEGLSFVGFDLTCRERFGLHLHIDLGINVGRIEGDVAEPSTDRVDVNSRAKKMSRCCMTNRVWANTLVLQRRDAGRDFLDISLHQGVYAESGDGLAASVEEDMFGHVPFSDQRREFRYRPWP